MIQFYAARRWLQESRQRQPANCLPRCCGRTEFRARLGWYAMKFGSVTKTNLPGFTVVSAMIQVLMVLMTLLLLPPTAVPQALQPKVRVSQVREHMLVSTEWLARHLTDSTVVVLHVARERADYDAGHLPGARFLAVAQITRTRGIVSNELAPVEDLKKVFESLGVGDKTRIILYGERQGLWAARAWFTLDYLGHGDKAALLNGNIEKWRRENRPLTTDAPSIKPASFSPHVQPAALVTLTMMRDLSGQAPDSSLSPVVLVDARPPEQYRGEESASDTPRPGHIPGAHSLYWMTALKSTENPQMLIPSKLRRLYKSAGITPGRRVVTYCHSGVQGAYAYFTAKYLGYDAALYDGSFQEWSNAAGTQVATGK
jgi:thiosulfate/3-mercaptopyruvate sulfurtransferase